jgi:hypothetical protein
MSQTVHCEKCAATGQVLVGFRGPRGWRFAEVVVDDEENPKQVTVIFACSEACSIDLWRPISELRSAMHADATSAEKPVSP